MSRTLPSTYHFLCPLLTYPSYIFFQFWGFLKTPGEKNILQIPRRVSRYHTHAATAGRSRWNKHMNKWIMQLIAGNGSWRSQMQTKHCSCLYSSICLGSPAGDLGDDSTHMPPSSGLPDFWYFTNPVEIYSSFCSVFWGRTSAWLAGTCLCSSSPIRGGWPMMLSWKHIPNHHDQGIQQWKILVLSQTSFRRMRSFQKILISKLLLPLAMLLFQTNWKALTDIF